MALSAPNTPKNSSTPRRTVKEYGFMPPSTPKTQLVTPKRTPKNPLAAGTPECFTNVVFETPSSAKRNRSSRDREKSDELSNLTVAVRVRPMNTRELAHVGSTNVVNVKDNNLFVKSSPIGNSAICMDHMFQYDHVFWSCDENIAEYSTQEQVFNTLGVPLLESAFKGYNACLFAYGQTGSGKSFSMMGRSEIDIDSEEYSGIIPRFCKALFSHIRELPDNCSATLDVSYFEIYNEKIHDLLLTQETVNKTALKVREHPMLGPYVENLSINSVKTFKELRSWLLLGNKNRATAATSMNEKSSRSHSIFTIELSLTDGLDENSDGSGRRSRVSLVDLAGSERLSHSHNSEEKIRQGVSINKSLLTLGKVISSLADQKKNQFVPYRDSVLTWLLRESLGGNSMTTMLATITPANLHVDETLATLRYACQARSIVNRARVNENPHEKLIRELRSEVLRLKSLKKNFERSSIGSNSSLHSNASNISGFEELEELRNKLNETENKLFQAEKVWEKRFMENRASQLRQLAEVEKRKEELESRIRIMENADRSINLSPYRTNFLEELEGVLLEENAQNIDECHNFRIVTEWCKRNNLNYSISRNALLLIDYKNNKQTVVTSSDLDNLTKYKDVGDFISNLTWNINKSHKILCKSDILKSMNTIYQTFSDLLPPDDDETLSLLYAKISKSLQKYESALLNSVSLKSCPKSVTFDL
ncbi:hypothetical protein HHI36_004601 [Cryptolaemus montrouzieri]|uniref:Kinesin-like protein n=1 Tax=Cryptolaemus montrouzieri TaxID=559131 RepID=A0ABD2NRN9_9CUCU